MSRNPSLLARLFGRSQSPQPIVAALYANAIGQPLLVHPQIGEQLIGGYLHGAVDARPPTMTIGEIAPGNTDPATGVVTKARTVAVMNVSGGLVNRFEGDFCDPGPLSYQELRASFDRAQADDTVEAIVLRIESPGGMASGLFDLADHIHASRGSKRIIASLDDYAYSAAYGLAAACDEIWITRTGGAGSVGVIAYHVDQSRWEQNIGVTVTQVFSGEHKADMSPHAPLSDASRAWLQERMDSMRLMFADAVARYRGMEVAAVLATEAQVYQGEQAVAVGFADRVGTFAELMSKLAAGWAEEADEGEREGDDEMKSVIPAAAPSVVTLELSADLITALEAAGAKAEAATDAALFAVEVAESSLPPAVSVALIKRGPEGQSPAQAISYARDVRDACFAAGLEGTAPDYITKNTDLATVRAQLTAAKAATGPEVVTAIPDKAASTSVPTSESVYESRRRAASASTSG